MTDTLNINDFYRTSDLTLAVVISLSYPIETIDRQNERRAEFLFRREEELDALVERYYRGELRLEPQMLFQQLRIVKARLYGNE